MQGAIAAIPTETVYGLSARYDDIDALHNIARLKQRPLGKEMLVLARSIEQAQALCAEWPESAQILAQNFWPGPLTIVVASRAGGTLGIRVSSNSFVAELMELMDAPLVSTSANIAGEAPAASAAEAVRFFGAALDWVADCEAMPPSLPSTIVRVADTGNSILREGAIAAQDVAGKIKLTPP